MTEPNELDQDPAKSEQLANIERLLQNDFTPPEPVQEKPATPVEADPETAALLSELFFAGFTMMAARKGAHWALSEKEAQTLGSKSARVLDKYLPSFESGPEAALIACVVLIVGPRLAIDIRNRPVIEGQSVGDQPESRAA